METEQETQNIHPWNEIRVHFRLLAVLLAALALFVLTGSASNSGHVVSRASHTALAAAPALNISLIAQSAILLNVSSGEIIYAKHENAQLPLASITKLFLIDTLADIVDPMDTVTVSARAVELGEGGLGEREMWLAGDLMAYTLVVSSNVGAEALTETADALIPTRIGDDPNVRPTIRRMNEKARTLGLLNTYFINSTGLDFSDTQAGAFGSAHDVARFLAYLYPRADLFASTIHPTQQLSALNADTEPGENTNDALPQIPGLVLGKTGFTDLAGGNLAILFDLGPGNTFAAVVLGSTKEGRFKDIETLVEAAEQSLQRQ